MSKFLRLPVVIERTGYSQSSIYDFMTKGQFPKAIKLGGRAVGWIESEVDAWMKDRIEQSRKAA